MEDDRRAAIEAAFASAAEAAGEQNAQTEGLEDPSKGATSKEQASEGEASKTSELSTAGEETPEGTSTEGVPAETPPEGAKPVDQAPASWKPAQKAKWAALDPEVRQEVLRRDREISTALHETTSVRTFAKQFQEAVAPFAPRLQAMGAHPLTAVQKLLQADYVLATGSKQQRAELLVKLIKDYDVDVEALDAVLAGRTSPQAAEEDRIARLLDQRLAPVQQYLTTQQQREQQEQQRQEAEWNSSVQAMANDPAYVHFEAVRNTMADLIEINARQGITQDLKTVYNRAVAIDPALTASNGASQQTKLAELAAQRAQRAKQASLSVNGAPSGGLAKPNPSDRRATISAAFEALTEDNMNSFMRSVLGPASFPRTGSQAPKPPSRPDPVKSGEKVRSKTPATSAKTRVIKEPSNGIRE